MKKLSWKQELDKATVVSTTAEWAVIIVILVLMASIWSALKQPASNFAHAYPVASTILVVVSAALFFGLIWWFGFVKEAQGNLMSSAKAGSVSIQGGSVRAGHGGNKAPGGDATIKAGDGYGVSGGDVTIGPGDYRAGDAGEGGKGGDLTIKAGDAKGETPRAAPSETPDK